MDDKKKKTPSEGTSVQGDVNTHGGDFVGRDKNVNGGNNSVVVGGNVNNSNIIFVGDKALYSPISTAATAVAVEHFGPSKDLLEKSLLRLGDSTYVVQKVIISQNQGNLLLQAASASDQIMQENVGIFHLNFITKQDDTPAQLQRARQRAQNMKHAADRSRHLTTIRKILPYDQGLWVVSQWVTGMPWSQFYPFNGALPSRTDILQITAWAIDICNALAALHRFRELHSGLSEETIILNKNRGVMLIDPGFTGHPTAGKMLPRHFDPQIDIRALGTVLYRTLTHQIPNGELASTFNMSISSNLANVIQKVLDGSLKNVIDLKSQLIRLKNEK